MGRSKIIEVNDKSFIFNNSAFTVHMKKKKQRDNSTAEAVYKALEERICVNRSTILNWVRHKNGPGGGISMIEEIAHFLNIAPNELLLEVKTESNKKGNEETTMKDVDVGIIKQYDYHTGSYELKKLMLEEGRKDARLLVIDTYKKLVEFIDLMVQHGVYKNEQEVKAFYYRNKNLINKIRSNITGSAINVESYTRTNLMRIINYLEKTICEEDIEQHEEVSGFVGILSWESYIYMHDRKEAIEEDEEEYLLMEQDYLNEMGISYKKPITNENLDVLCSNDDSIDELLSYVAGSSNWKILPIDIWGYILRQAISIMINDYFKDIAINSRLYRIVILQNDSKITETAPKP